MCTELQTRYGRNESALHVPIVRSHLYGSATLCDNTLFALRRYGATRIKVEGYKIVSVHYQGAH